MYTLHEVGRTKKAVGYEGHMRVVINDRYVEDLKSAPAVFIEYGFEKIPFFIDDFDEDGLIHFDDVLDKETATQLTGKPIYLREQDIRIGNQGPEPEKMDFDILQGWKILSVDETLEGTIDRIESYPQQQMAFVIVGDREIMIPLHEELIIEVDMDQELIIMSLPEGLLEI